MSPDDDGALTSHSAPNRSCGGTGELIEGYDWACSPLGTRADWPQSLKTLVEVMLGSKQAMVIVWGPRRTLLYNDSYAEILASKHPAALGRDFLEVWSEIRADLLPFVEAAYAGQPVHIDDIELWLERDGLVQEEHFAFSYTPVRNDEGTVMGFFCPCIAITDQVLSQRQGLAEAVRQRRLFEQAPGFIAILAEPAHIFQFANAAYRQLVGGRDPVGKPVREALPELAEQGVFELLDQVFQSGERFVAQSRPIRLAAPDGEMEERFLNFIYEPVTDETGRVTGIFVEGHDVTDSHRTEAALRESEVRRSAALAAAQLGTFEWNLDTDAVTLDERSREIFGFGADEGSTAQDIFNGIHPDDFTVIRAKATAAAEGLDKLTVEYRILRPDGGVRTITSSSDALRGKDGEADRMVGVFADISESKATEAALNELNATLESQVAERTAERNRVWEMSRDLLAILGFDGQLKTVNPAWKDILGREAEGLFSLPFRELVHPDDLDAVLAVLARLKEGETIEGFEDRLQHADGSWRWISWTLVPDREVFYAVGRDVTAAKERAAWLRLHENIVQSDRSPICAFDASYRLIAFNKAHNDEFRRVNGFDTAIGDVFPDLFVEEQRPVMRALMDRALGGEQFIAVEEFGRPEFGKPHWEITYTPLCNEAGQIIGAFHHAKDITQRLQAQAELEAVQDQLRQSQKLESMGQLTGGVAHDVNNLLTPIMGSLDLLRRRGIGTEREQRMIDGALQSAERARVLVQRLLAFARRQPLQPVPVDITTLVIGMADLVASTSGPRVRVELDLAPGLPAAMVDANQLEMAILNLAVNARDAMEEGGTLTITANLATNQEPGAPAQLADGRYIRVALADTGVGMDEATVRRAIEPFYSTKGIGKGTGLGLSMAHGLAAQLGGALYIESRPTEGTTVALWLPVSEEAVRSAEQKHHGQSSAGTGTALLVDDEELVRLSTADILIDLGYAVVEAESGEEALRLIDDGLRFDLLLTDHLMPGMTGTDLARRVRDRQPDIPVLLISGYAEVEGVAADLPRLTKPFRRDDLIASLATCRNAAAQPSGIKGNR